jgi:hypothetical protein
LLARVRIERSHDATRTEVSHTDDYRTNLQLQSFPSAFSESRHAADNQIRPKTPPVVPNSSEHPVCCYQQRKDIESIFGVAHNQLGSSSRRGFDIAGDFLGIPRKPVDEHLVVIRERGTVPKQ